MQEPSFDKPVFPREPIEDNGCVPGDRVQNVACLRVFSSLVEEDPPIRALKSAVFKHNMPTVGHSIDAHSYDGEGFLVGRHYSRYPANLEINLPLFHPG